MQPDKKKFEKKSWKKNLKNILLDFFSDKKRWLIFSVHVTVYVTVYVSVYVDACGPDFSHFRAVIATKNFLNMCQIFEFYSWKKLKKWGVFFKKKF